MHGKYASMHIGQARVVCTPTVWCVHRDNGSVGVIQLAM